MADDVISITTQPSRVTGVPKDPEVREKEIAELARLCTLKVAVNQVFIPPQARESKQNPRSNHGLKS